MSGTSAGADVEYAWDVPPGDEGWRLELVGGAGQPVDLALLGPDGTRLARSAATGRAALYDVLVEPGHYTIVVARGRAEDGPYMLAASVESRRFDAEPNDEPVSAAPLADDAVQPERLAAPGKDPDADVYLLTMPPGDANDPRCDVRGWRRARARAVSLPGRREPPVPPRHIILDTSGSMRNGIDGVCRIQMAKDSRRSLLTEALAEGVPVAIRAFGGRGKGAGCDTRLALPLAPLDREVALRFVRKLDAPKKAATPIAAALEHVSDDLAAVEGARILLLITDGAESCDGDPGAAVEALRQSGVDVTLNSVGFALDDEVVKAQLAGWAAAADGAYSDATGAEDLGRRGQHGAERPLPRLCRGCRGWGRRGRAARQRTRRRRARDPRAGHLPSRGPHGPIGHVRGCHPGRRRACEPRAANRLTRSRALGRPRRHTMSR